MNSITRWLLRVYVALRSPVTAWRLCCLGVRVHGPCWFSSIEVPRHHKAITLSRCALDYGVTLLVSDPRPGHPTIQIDEGVYINRYTMVGPYCYLTDHEHGVEGERPLREQPLVAAATRIRSNVWIGAHASVLKGVTIGDRAVVAAGAVVTRDVPAGCAVAGVPAQLMPRDSTTSNA
ncbi:MAG: acyltransferase [Gammaproteobacteria bacterium]|nr:acyltransferase [Gammaproteobacteria bacterium]